MSTDSLGDYLRQIDRYPQLTPAEEIELARLIRAANDIKFMAVGKSTKAQRITLRRGERARRRMIEGNLRLVVTAARQQARARRQQSMELLDLISHGNIGLAQAVDRFDHTRGYKFSTYAFWWIRQAISRGLANEDHTIRLPIHVMEAETRLRRAIGKSMREGQPVDLDAAATEAGVDRDIARRILQLQTTQSLDVVISGTDGSTLLQILADPHQDADETEREDDLAALLQRLDERSRQLVIRRYGLDGSDAKTLRELGQDFGITSERTRQLLNNALRQLQTVHQQGLQQRDRAPATPALDLQRATARPRGGGGVRPQPARTLTDLESDRRRSGIAA